MQDDRKYRNMRVGGKGWRRLLSILCAAAVLCAVNARAQEETESAGDSEQVGDSEQGGEISPQVEDSTPQAVAGSFTAVRVASGLTQPVFVTAPPGDTTHIYIVQQTGQIIVLDLQTSARSTFFTVPGIQAAGEQGLLGMAFDPNYASNGKFYLNFVVPGGAFRNGVTHVSQFKAATPTPTPRRRKKKKRKNVSTERILLTFVHPQTNHNGGWIGFSARSGDQNNLYIATGDGGNGNDQGIGHLEPGGNAQSNTTLLGKMLRIHIDSNTGAVTIPSDNPFFSSGTFRREIWAFGLRNPFRDSFDRLNGRMFIGDVGQNTREEIDVQEATNPGGGENYGWRLREGSIATPSGNPVVGGPPPPGNVDPILDYDRSTGGTVIGGYVYRGSQIPALQGKYIFGDYLFGRIFTLDYDGTIASNFTDITSLLFPPSGGFTLSALSSFGEDANGELYICDIGAGVVYKIVP
jgi:glucose/arabinose dehydrogenase